MRDWSSVAALLAGGLTTATKLRELASKQLRSSTRRLAPARETPSCAGAASSSVNVNGSAIAAEASRSPRNRTPTLASRDCMIVRRCEALVTMKG